MSENECTRSFPCALSFVAFVQFSGQRVFRTNTTATHPDIPGPFEWTNECAKKIDQRENRDGRIFLMFFSAKRVIIRLARVNIHERIIRRSSTDTPVRTTRRSFVAHSISMTADGRLEKTGRFARTWNRTYVQDVASDATHAGARMNFDKIARISRSVWRGQFNEIQSELRTPDLCGKCFFFYTRRVAEAKSIHSTSHDRLLVGPVMCESMWDDIYYSP